MAQRSSSVPGHEMILEEHSTEEQLIERAQSALNSCNWEIGACAAAWTRRFARGRTDADFGALVGLSGDQVYQRRRVWETFSDIYERYEELRWSHFYAALNWDDASECLQWACDMSATVAEMRAWRRAQHGEDLDSAEGDAAVALSGVEVLQVGAGVVRDPNAGGGERGGRGATNDSREREAPVVAGAPRSAESKDDYAPFGAQARGQAPAEADRPPPDPEAVLRRVVGSLERSSAALTPAVLEAAADAPEELLSRWRSALKELSAKSRSVLH